MIAPHDTLNLFSPPVREWFAASFPQPTPAQQGGWPHIVAGKHTLICAPTGSGKTLTAFLAAIDRLTTVSGAADSTPRRVRTLYISPLRALAFDVEKNLRAPLIGIGHAATRLGQPFNEPTVGMRTGDTPPNERQKLVRRPPDVLITTPESLYLMLTSQARTTLRGVETVIIDEIHALAATKRGAHLALSLERLVEICDRPPQRIGLSATQRPLTETARFLGGYENNGTPRPVQIVDAGISKPLEIEIVVPLDDMTAPAADGTPSIWPSMYPKVLDLILAHHSTIVFCNARRAAERLAAKLNEAAAERGIGVDADTGEVTGEIVKAHHGSLAREQRVVIEDQLKAGTLQAIVATSSLELGIDMGAVDLVIQIESPGAVSRGLQRVGRAGHQVGEASRGSIFPKHRADLIESAVVARQMLAGEIEQSTYLRNPLDVLIQQLVAIAATDEDTDIAVETLAQLVRRSANFHDLSHDLFTNSLDLIAGRYPSDEFSELRPRVVWDRIGGTVRARRGAKRLAVTSGGTIPDRGLFGVFLPDGTRVGELDEEMVYETRPGEAFILGASTWRIEDISFAKVIVTPAPGVPARMPFWRGDALGRPVELGRAIGEFLRQLRSATTEDLAELGEKYRLDPNAAANIVRYVQEQIEATGVLPDDRTIIVERFRDEIGDWRVCILSPFGTPVHAPWAIAIERGLNEQHDVTVETMWTDDGIVIRLPEALDEISIDSLLIDPDEIEAIIVEALPQTSLFAARFREAAGRALLLPRRRPDQRTPLWQQRQRAADLLAVAAQHPTFPILLETSRECLQDVFDVPALRTLLQQLQSRQIRVVQVDTSSASPMAASLLFNWIAAYMYEGDAPLAERRATALSLDRNLLRELLGAEELRDLLDADVLDQVELELQRLADTRRARSVDELHDVLRVVGDLTALEAAARCEPNAPVNAWLEQLQRERRSVLIGMGQEPRFIDAADAGRYRDAFGVAIPVGLPSAFTDPVPNPLESLVARYARTHGPFLSADVAARFCTGEPRIDGALEALAADDKVVAGEFRPNGVHREWCDADVLRQVRRRSLAVLRKEVEPVEPAALVRFLPSWHTVDAPRRGLDAAVDAIDRLAGAPLIASTLERDLLADRIDGYRSSMLDELCTSGEVVWVGSGAIGADDGRIRLCFADQLPLFAPAWRSTSHNALPNSEQPNSEQPNSEQPNSDQAISGRAGSERPNSDQPDSELHQAIRQVLRDQGASFWNQLRHANPAGTDGELLAALWDLVWSGEVTNDSYAPVRALVGGGGVRTHRGGRRKRHRSRPSRVTRLGPAAAAGRWSLVVDLTQPPASETAAAHAQAVQLLERLGVVTREGVLAEGVRGGYASVYPVLKLLEERGEVRRGYFVAGLGAAQFALPGAVDRLRSMREPTGRPPIILSATDPAQPFGAAVPWPATTGRPARVGAALVVLADGELVAWFDRRSHHLVLFDDTAARPEWALALAGYVASGRAAQIEVRKVNGGAIPTASRELLLDAGFVDGYRGLTLRA